MCFPCLGTGFSWSFHGCTDYFPLLRIKVASVEFLTPELTLFHLIDCGVHEKSLSLLENEMWRAWEPWSSSCTLCPLSLSYLACHSGTVPWPIGVHSLQPLQQTLNYSDVGGAFQLPYLIILLSMTMRKR